MVTAGSVADAGGPGVAAPAVAPEGEAAGVVPVVPAAPALATGAAPLPPPEAAGTVEPGSGDADGPGPLAAPSP